MIILLKQECQKHLKLLTSEFNQTFDQPRSQCSTLTFKQIKHFLRDSACELSRELHSRHRKLRKYPLLLVSVFLLLLSVHVTIILTNLTVLTDRKFLSTVLIPPLLLPLITLTTNPSTTSLPLSIIPHPHGIQPSAPNLSSTLLIMRHPYAIAYVARAANVKLKLKDTGGVTNAISTTLSSI